MKNDDNLGLVCVCEKSNSDRGAKTVLDLPFEKVAGRMKIGEKERLGEEVGQSSRSLDVWQQTRYPFKI